MDVGGSGKAGYLVRLFNGVDGAGAEWGNTTTSSTGEAVFYVPEDSYRNRVDRSEPIGSKIGLTASVGATQTVTYTLARITVHVQTSGGNTPSGYLVRLFNGTSLLAYTTGLAA